jgi:FkbH-like protein
MNPARELRRGIEADLRDGNWGLARQHLAQLWQREPTMAVSSYILGCGSRLRGHVPLTPFKLAILRSFTVEPVVTLLRAGALVGGIDLDVQVGDFNAYAQAILDPAGGLYRFQPDGVLLAVLSRDLGPELERAADAFAGYLKAFRARSDASLVIQGLEETMPAAGDVNARLRRLADQQPGTYFLDYQELVARHGAAGWNDERNWATTRLPLANSSLIHLARAWLRFVHPLAGKLCKVLVSDLDNTLWGGVVGEDGWAGLQCAPSGAGQPYHALQQALLEIRERGVLLAVCSQNNAADALEALEKHPGLLLRPQHFAAQRINWESKARNLRGIADELNLGTDTLAFVDDDPVQLERVRAELPEVHVIELPQEVERRAEVVREDPVFARLRLSREDLDRSRHYAEQRARQKLQEQAPSLEDFYRTLEQQVAIARVDPESAERAAQLTQKTNQFNLTTRRYSVQQLLELAARPQWRVFTVRVSDRFGDNGLTGIAITHEDGGACEIDSLLLSCRIIGRTVETAVLAFLLERARRCGLREVKGSYVPTRKNGVVKDFFAAHAFEALGEREGASGWAIDPALAAVVCPSWIRLSVEEGALA